ncbi:uncharacterized protein BDZ99DRAFT_572164 [Mytilinidion resinicola]|uniref:F-box domain-containing protein n=1 Tax=Mytilinidion resinicola TaxID=574789 RepID=A0A6A6YJY8_9PEZI|nr:uncharacterized protein BDZ99DRAFT_572164 [Mytilinidion resinicola]KAF2808275.1 hypothetical protein BDZ99DRAFT_572164 [Mytilinidion resinicola]
MDLDPSEPASLQTLPLELLFEIYAHLLAPLPTHYSYTAAAPSTGTPASTQSLNVPALRGSGSGTPKKQTKTNPPRPLRTHGMLLANHALSAHYIKAFYARTNFFFYVDAHNARAKAWFALPAGALAHVRACKLYIEVHQIARDHHHTEAHLAAFVKRVERLLRRLKKLRQVQLVWDVGPVGRGAKKGLGVALDWEGLGEPFVEMLKGMQGVREFMVTVGEQIERFRREKGGWGVYGEGVEGGSRVAKGPFPFL